MRGDFTRAPVGARVAAVVIMAVVAWALLVVAIVGSYDTIAALIDVVRP
jgi:nitrate reductase NapE component